MAACSEAMRDGELRVEGRQRLRLGEAIAQAVADLGRHPLLLGLGRLEAGGLLAQRPSTALGLGPGDLGLVTLVLEQPLGGAELVGGVELVAVGHVEQGLLRAGLVGGVLLEDREELIATGADVGIDRRRHDLGAQLVDPPLGRPRIALGLGGTGLGLVDRSLRVRHLGPRGPDVGLEVGQGLAHLGIAGSQRVDLTRHLGPLLLHRTLVGGGVGARRGRWHHTRRRHRHGRDDRTDPPDATRVLQWQGHGTALRDRMVTGIAAMP